MSEQTASPDDEATRLRRDVARLEARIGRLERDLASVRPLIDAVRGLKIWDYTPYEVAPDQEWVAIDRGDAEGLLAALARVDHWVPWQTRLEPRPPS